MCAGGIKAQACVCRWNKGTVVCAGGIKAQACVYWWNKCTGVCVQVE